MSNANLGWGTIFQTDDLNSPGISFTFPEVVGISGPKYSMDVIDTSHELPPFSVKTSFGGMRDFGEVQISFNLDPNGTGIAYLMGEYQNPIARFRRIQYPDGKKWEFFALMTGFECTEGVGDKLSATATFRITGAVAFI